MLTTVLPASGTSEKHQKENNSRKPTNYFIVVDGIVIIDAVVAGFGPHYFGYTYTFTPVKKVTLIGYGFYYPGDLKKFYINTFTNVTRIDGDTFFRHFHVSQAYQHIIMFPSWTIPTSTCILQF